MILIKLFSPQHIEIFIKPFKISLLIMEGAYDFKVVEPAVLAFWEKNRIYEKAKSRNKGKKKFYFLDGPPYTSGRIHLGQAWNKALKDCVLRYKRMSGFDVYDRAGYDMHGLPTAHKVEEKFKLKDKDDIIKFGIDKFVDECKKFSVENMNLMTKDFVRLGVWMDFENAYQPIQNSFIEGEWWLVKKAHENNRLYEGKRTMTWCPHCATALAKHELDYKTITDNSIFVKFPVVGKDNEFLIVWTTTPWTLAFNLAIMVNPELDYVKADVEGEKWIVAKALAPSLISAVANKKFKVIEEFKGEKLAGLKYEHPWKKEIKFFSELKNDKLHTIVLSSEYVDTSAGSGLVHCAPGCGPEDYEVGHREGLPPFNNIDEYGTFPESMGKFSGLIARKDDKKFTDSLGEHLIETTKVEHEYAHCWRCHNPVIFRTTKQWFFKIEDLKEQMRFLNKKVFWQPDWAGSRQFDSWLDNLRDNSITKQRFWGTPLPIWKCYKCNDYVVIGSLAELKKLAGKVPKDLHKPWIDEVTIKCKCGGIKKRIPDILDVWIDAGTTSWTCLDYPQKKDLFKNLFPPDFILEGKDQIRGWFNLLFVASMVSMRQPSYKAVYMHGFVQDALGRKMSKSLGNVISPYEVIDKYGSDTLRFYMISGTNPGIDINYNFEDMKVKNRNLIVLWNLHRFLIDYSKNLNITKIDKKITEKLFSTEERYIFSVLNSAIKKFTALFEEYRLNEVPLLVEELFLELSRTYIQLVREKSSTGSEEERRVVFYTIYNVLLESLKLFAPVCPFITEQMYQNLREVFNLKPESIHLCDIPSYDGKAIDRNLENNMKIVSNIVQSTLAAREKAQLGVRWPIKEVIVVTKDENTIKAIESLEDIIKLQTNVKEVKVQNSLSAIKTQIKADYSQIGQDFGDLTPKIIAKVSMESPETMLSHLEKEGKYPMGIEGKKVNIVKEHLIVERDVPYPFEESAFSNGFVYINKERTKELEAEGFAREVMRRVQALRKKAGLVKSDRITLFIKVDEDLKELLDNWEKQIKERVGASTMKMSELNPSKKHKFSSKEKVKGKSFEIFFDKL
jgi:isoleucyl-tRNA synthetase